MRIEIIDDGNFFCATLHAILKSQPSLNFVTAGDAKPEIIVSSHIWRRNSAEDLQLVRRMAPGIPILVVTDQIPQTGVRPILAMGAAGILLQESVARHISWAIPAISNGYRVLSPEISESMISEYLGPSSRTSQERSARERILRLSQREQEVLELVSRGMSNREIAAELFISPETVKDHVRSIRAKLDVANRVHAARVAWLARDAKTRTVA
ncbi:DNA-binding response regulator [Streptomyces sp. NPDC059866]|uniref:response regulator transcription factor n=1 Tax=Streptomyces sp. NPDC059866 TaxID=3346978 RepID=UPI0036472ADD